MRSSTAAAAVEEVRALAMAGLGLIELWQASADVIGEVVPDLLSPCWYTLDPASLLITSHFNEQLEAMPEAWLEAEYYEDDVNKLSEVARSPSGISTLHDAMGGDPSSSPRWIENSKYGGDQEMIAALRTGAGETWGAVGLYRGPGAPLFGAAELVFVQSLSVSLADAAARALLVADAKEPDHEDAPGLLVLTEDWEVVARTAAVDALLDDLPDGDPRGGVLPSSVVAVASQVLRPGPGAAGDAVARVRARSGRWLLLHASPLVERGRAEVTQATVIIEPAHPARIAPLLMAAYGLTPREQEVTRHVLKGRSTSEIASALFISAHTVQEHLKHVFEKAGVRSRRDLVGKVFFGHYEPRVRDNERRAASQRPLRGGPAG